MGMRAVFYGDNNEVSILTHRPRGEEYAFVTAVCGELFGWRVLGRHDTWDQASASRNRAGGDVKILGLNHKRRK